MTVIKINKTNFESEVKQSNLPVIVDFWASWCGPCQMLGPIFEEVSESYNDKLKFTKISTEEEPELANQFQITGIPCLIILNNGKEVDRIVGFSPKEELKQKIDSILENLK